MNQVPKYRKALRRQEREEQPCIRYITFSCYRRLPLLIQPSAEFNARRFAESLPVARRRHRFELVAWVVMPEHVHLLVRPAVGCVWATIASAIKNPVAKAALADLRAKGSALLREVTDASGCERFWQAGGGFDRNVRDEGEFAKAVRYIHHNPVERGIAQHPAAWPYSSVRWWAGVRANEVECDPPPGHGWESWKGYA